MLKGLDEGLVAPLRLPTALTVTQPEAGRKPEHLKQGFGNHKEKMDISILEKVRVLW